MLESGPPAARDVSGKRPYSPPTLTRYGTVVAVTGSKSQSSFRDTMSGAANTLNIKVK
jgi:hypothetical protein